MVKGLKQEDHMILLRGGQSPLIKLKIQKNLIFSK